MERTIFISYRRDYSEWIRREMESWFFAVSRGAELMRAIRTELSSLENALPTIRQDPDGDRELVYSAVRKDSYTQRRKSLQQNSRRVQGYWTPQRILAYDEPSILRYATVQFDTQATDFAAHLLQGPQKIAVSSRLYPCGSDYISDQTDPCHVTEKESSRVFLAQILSFGDLQAAADQFILNLNDAHDDLKNQIYESILLHLNAFKKQINHIYHAILVALSLKVKFQQGIRKGIEGYIPFQTWARGSLEAQLVKQLFFTDKLSQLNTV